MDSNGIAVECRGITKEFGFGSSVTRVLNDISLKIAKGEFVSVMGPSGSGKSTLLYILGGLDSPTAGNVLLDGEDIARFDDKKKSIMRRRNIGFVFQFYNLIPNLNVEENILLPVLLDGKNVKAYGRQLSDILEITGLADRKEHTPRELSGGQQQRVAIARALINSPGIIFADEPTGNLDSRTGTGIMKLLQEINRESGKTVVMVTHSADAASYGGRIISVRDGTLV